MLRTMCLVACALSLTLGCGEAVDEAETTSASQPLFIGGGTPGARCTIRQTGGFNPITKEFEITGTQENGCQKGERCVPVACTNAIPPTCYGFCQAAPGPKSPKSPYFPSSSPN